METNMLPNKYLNDLKELETVLNRKLAERPKERILSEVSIGCWIYGAGGPGGNHHQRNNEPRFSITDHLTPRKELIKSRWSAAHRPQRPGRGS